MNRHVHHRRRRYDGEGSEVSGSAEDEESHHHVGLRARSLLLASVGRLRCKHLLFPALCFLVGLLAGIWNHQLFENEQYVYFNVVQQQPQQRNAPRNSQQQQPQQDVCIVANALEQDVLNIQSYFPLDPITIPDDAIPHVSSALCFNDYILSSLRNDRHEDMPPLKSIFVFKAARTGSTFVTQVITNTIKHMGLPASMFWEPFANIKCNGPNLSPDGMETALKTLLTKECVVGPNPGIDKCTPDKNCNETSSPNHTVFVTATNPRFLHSNVNWSNVLDDSSRILSLRRTNLVLLSYSKYNHGGCRIDNFNYREPRKFTLGKLLRCAEHYGLGDQEYSSSVAFHASRTITTSQAPFLVVYEDVMMNGTLVQEGITHYFGLNITRQNMFQEDVEMEKVHTGNFCDYADVNCKILSRGLSNKYPCLYKQLQNAHEGWTWTVPMLPNGTLSIHGDCKPLPALTKDKFVRTFDELYQVPQS